MISTTVSDGCVKVECDGKTIARCDSEKDAERIKRALEHTEMRLVVFEANQQQDELIEDVLDLADSEWQFAANGKTRTDALVAVLEDWRKRVTAEETTDKRTKMHLLLDEDDFRDIAAAIERRKSWDCEPDSDSCDAGASIAEICRGWLERVEHDKSESERSRHDAAEAIAKHDAKPRRTDNGDGTVTFHGIDVTVRADVLGGRDVVAVRRVESDERYIDSFGNAQTCFSGNDNRLHIILGPKPQALAQAFIEGCTYRDGKGNLCGPLVPSGSIEYPLKDQRGDMYTTDGKCRLARPDAMANLVPGEVIVWRHPGLKAGEYTWDGRLIKCGGMIVLNQLTSHHISAWTDPPRAGTWKVIQGQEYATWEGE